MKNKYEIEKKKLKQLLHPLLIGHNLKIFDQIFRGTTKINGIYNAIDQGMHNLHSHSKVQTFEVTEDDVTHGTQEHFSPP
jgi:hypothetical protein